MELALRRSTVLLPQDINGGITVKAKIITCLLAIIMVWAYGTPAWAQLKPGGSGASSGPISISADRLETDDPRGTVTFIGAVVARQGEMTITCDTMKVHYITSEKPGLQAASSDGGEGDPLRGSDRQIDRVECEGNVKVVEGERLAVGNKALYLAKSTPRRIILTGQARVWQGRDSVTGHQVTYFLDESRSLVESGGTSGRDRERVRTIYHQQDAQ